MLSATRQRDRTSRPQRLAGDGSISFVICHSTTSFVWGGEKDADFAAALHGMHSLGPIANERVANLEDPMLVGGTQAELRRRVARSVARQDVSHLQAHQGGWIRTKSCMAICMAVPGVPASFGQFSE